MRKYVCGIDENGFGPILGPLIVTGMLTEEKVKFPPYIKDSKIYYKNKNDFKKIEEIAILSFYIIEKKIPNSPYEIFKRFVNNFCIFEDKICEKNIPLHFQNINLENLIQKHKEIIKEKEKIKEIKV
ncbi:MAG: hypothetical protein N2589_05935, partial [bacterium]|nr:hypothetical protein [bacterium]